jgi:ssDNA-binding Zn-finger/Zn-ribbon topoisomerase 1
MTTATTPTTAPPCPEHGATMQIREGRTGRFWGCARYPACRHTVPIGLPGITCPTCGGPVVERVAKRSGRPFWPCGMRGCRDARETTGAVESERDRRGPVLSVPARWTATGADQGAAAMIAAISARISTRRRREKLAEYLK